MGALVTSDSKGPCAATCDARLTRPRASLHEWRRCARVCGMYDALAMSKSASKTRRNRTARKPTRARTAAAPSETFWAELLATLTDLRAQVQRLADVGEGQPPVRHLDWARFTESRKVAAEDRERYWHDMDRAAAGK